MPEAAKVIRLCDMVRIADSVSTCRCRRVRLVFRWALCTVAVHVDAVCRECTLTAWRRLYRRLLIHSGNTSATTLNIAQWLHDRILSIHPQTMIVVASQATVIMASLRVALLESALSDWLLYQRSGKSAAFQSLSLVAMWLGPGLVPCLSCLPMPERWES